jgi:hypothetical protein
MACAAVFVDPSDAVKAAIDLHGSQAQTAVAYCALDARFDGRSADYWCSVFRDLTAAFIELDAPKAAKKPANRSQRAASFS